MQLSLHSHLTHVPKTREAVEENLVCFAKHRRRQVLPSPIRFTDVFESQLPNARLCIADCDAMIFGDNIRLNR